MKKYFHDIFILSIISSILYLLIGIILILFPELTVKTVAYIIGFSIFISGIIGLGQFLTSKTQTSTYILAYSIFCIVLSIAVFINTKSFISLFPMIIGLLLLITGIYRLKYAFLLKDNGRNWIVAITISLIIILFGILIIVNPFKSSIVFTTLIGIYIIIYAILNIIDDLMLRKNLKDTIKFFKNYLK